MFCHSSDVRMLAGPPKEGYAAMFDRDLVIRGFQKRVLFMLHYVIFIYYLLSLMTN